jgi:uncharacterized membrane protein
VFFGPFLLIYALIFFFLLVFVIALIEVGVIHYAFTMIGLPPVLAFLALFVSLVGSYINIPVTRVESTEPGPLEVVTSFGVRYRIPRHLATRTTTVAVNLGGAIVPVLVSLYVLIAQPSVILPAIVGIAVVSIVVHRFARPVRGLGIATPMFIPPIVAALAGYFLAALLASHTHADAIAYVSGVMGTLIGADLANLNRLADLGAPVASIGGAGTFDGIFLTGIVAVLLA